MGPKGEMGRDGKPGGQGMTGDDGYGRQGMLILLCKPLLCVLFIIIIEKVVKQQLSCVNFEMSFVFCVKENAIVKDFYIEMIITCTSQLFCLESKASIYFAKQLVKKCYGAWKHSVNKEVFQISQELKETEEEMDTLDQRVNQVWDILV